MANTFIAVEGPQDVELIAALLESIGFQKVVKVQDLGHVFCQRLISSDFPVGGDLHRRVSNPMFMFREPHWIAIQAAGTDTPQLVSLVGKVLNALKSFPGAFDAIGIIRDADDLLGWVALLTRSIALCATGILPVLWFSIFSERRNLTRGRAS